MFNDIDRYTKTIVHAHIDKHGHAPKWMGAFSEAVGYNMSDFWEWADEKERHPPGGFAGCSPSLQGRVAIVRRRLQDGPLRRR